jgi:hypothetical protein
MACSLEVDGLRTCQELHEGLRATSMLRRITRPFKLELSAREAFFDYTDLHRVILHRSDCDKFPVVMIIGTFPPTSTSCDLASQVSHVVVSNSTVRSGMDIYSTD